MLILKVNMFAACYFNTHRVQVPADRQSLPHILCMSTGSSKKCQPTTNNTQQAEQTEHKKQTEASQHFALKCNRLHNTLSV